MDLSHIDSSESPSEETSPPNQSASPPLGQNLQEPPRAIHKSLTEGFLKAKVGINFSRSLTELNGDYLKVDASFYGKFWLILQLKKHRVEKVTFTIHSFLRR